MKIRITKKGLPKAQWQNSQYPPNSVGNFNLPTASNWSNDIWPYKGFDMGTVPNASTSIPATDKENKGPLPDMGGSYVWKNFNTGVAPTPRYEVVNADGSKEQFGNFGESKTFYKTANDAPTISDFKIPKPDVKRNYIADFQKLGDVIKGASILGSSIMDDINRKKRDTDFSKWKRNQMNSDALFNAVEGSDGDYVTTGSRFGEFRPNDYVVNKGMFAQYGGENQEIMKIRITKQPSMAYGGQSGSGLDLGSRDIYTDMPSTKSESYSNTISAVPRNEANIEAEGGETIYGDLNNDGKKLHKKIVGPRHSKGGVPLNVPEGTFIFSDTQKMKIKDPEILSYFGMPEKKGGYTPAEIAKKYDVNKYIAILEDPTSDDISLNTANRMIENYQKKLEYLAMVQESMKGFPQGVPSVSQGLLEDENEAELDQAKYGGALPKFQGSKGSSTVSNNRVPVWDDEQRKLLEEYLKQKYTVNIPINARDLANDAQRFTLPSMQNTIKGKTGVYGDEDWTSVENMADFVKRQKKFISENPGWNPRVKGATQKFQRWYDAERVKKGMKPYFSEKNSFRAYDDKFGEYTFSAPDIEPTQATAVTSQPVLGFICQGLDNSNSPVIVSSSFKDEQARSAAGAFSTKEEAAASCQSTAKDKPSYTPPGEKPLYNNEEPPFGYMLPDVINLGIAAINKPKKYLPYKAPVNLPKVKPTFYDPNREIAAQNEAANMFAQSAALIGNPQAYMANVSKLQGSLGEGVANTIGRVQNQNVGVANQFAGINADILGKENLLAMQRANDLYDAGVISNQQFDNALAKYRTNIGDKFAMAFNNRMNLGLINAVNPMYRIDPFTGKSYFTKRGYNTNMLGRQGNQNADPMSAYGSIPMLKKKLMENGLTESEASSEALRIIRGNSATSYTDNDMDGYPDRATFSRRGAPDNYLTPFNMNNIGGLNMLNRKMGGLIGSDVYPF
jgi:hypothetical protein